MKLINKIGLIGQQELRMWRQRCSGWRSSWRTAEAEASAEEASRRILRPFRASCSLRPSARRWPSTAKSRRSGAADNPLSPTPPTSSSSSPTYVPPLPAFFPPSSGSLQLLPAPKNIQRILKNPLNSLKNPQMPQESWRNPLESPENPVRYWKNPEKSRQILRYPKESWKYSEKIP